MINSLLTEASNIEDLIFTNSTVSGNAGLRIRVNNGGDFIGAVNLNNTDAFSLFLRTCQIIADQIELKLIENDQWTQLVPQNATLIQNTFSNKTICKLRLYKDGRIKEFNAFFPPSPSGAANIGLANNQIFQNFLHVHGMHHAVGDFKRFIWQNVLIGNTNNLIELH